VHGVVFDILLREPCRARGWFAGSRLAAERGRAIGTIFKPLSSLSQIV